MHILIRHHRAKAPVKIAVDLQDPPTIVRPDNDNRLVRPLSLDWDRAVDDELHLRRCPVCRCEDLYARKPVPQITAFLLVLLAAVAAMLLYGIGELLMAVIALVVVLIVDLIILVKARPALICYQCGSEFHDIKVPRRHPRWDHSMVESYRNRAIDPLAPKPGESLNHLNQTVTAGQPQSETTP